MPQQPLHEEKECKAGFHFIEIFPSYSIPPTEWLFIIGFVILILILFSVFMFLRHVYHMLTGKVQVSEVFLELI